MNNIHFIGDYRQYYTVLSLLQRNYKSPPLIHVKYVNKLPLSRIVAV
jgi:hypothetical protein